MGRPVLIEHLDRLGRELAARGWGARVRYAETPPILLVTAPGTRYGEIVYVLSMPLGDGWFVSGTATPLAPVGDVRGAAERVIALIDRYRATAEYFGFVG